MPLITLACNANQAKKKPLDITDASLDKLRTAAKNKLRIKATRFFMEDGSELLESALALPQGAKVLCSMGEDFVGTNYSTMQNPSQGAGPDSADQLVDMEAVATPNLVSVSVVEAEIPLKPAPGPAAASTPVETDAAPSSPSPLPASSSAASSALRVDDILLPGEKGAIRWLSVGGGRLALWHRPGGKASLKLKSIAGATMIATLLAEREGAETIGMQARAAGLDWTWHALDGAESSYLETDDAIQEMTRATVTVCTALRKGASVLLHCSAGIHRTGSVGYAILRSSGYGVSAALSALGSMRTVTGEGVDQSGRGGKSAGGERTKIVERHVVPAASRALSEVGAPTELA